MSAMKIDLRVIKSWVAQWQKGTGVNQTASQLAAVMLSKALEESEKRSARMRKVLKGMMEEGGVLRRLEKVAPCDPECREPLDAAKAAELREHRRKMAVLLREGEQVMNAPEGIQPVMVGGLLLEINKDETTATKGESSSSDEEAEPQEGEANQ